MSIKYSEILASDEVLTAGNNDIVLLAIVDGGSPTGYTTKAIKKSNLVTGGADGNGLFDAANQLGTLAVSAFSLKAGIDTDINVGTQKLNFIVNGNGELALNSVGLSVGHLIATSKLHVKDGDVNFEGLGDSELFYLDESTDRIGLGVIPTAAKFHLKGTTTQVLRMDSDLSGGALVYDFHSDVDTSDYHIQKQFANGTWQVGQDLSDAAQSSMSWANPGTLTVENESSSNIYVGHNLTLAEDVYTVDRFGNFFFGRNSLNRWIKWNAFQGLEMRAEANNVPTIRTYDTGGIERFSVNESGAVDALSYAVGGVAGFTGTGAYTNFTIVGGIITNAT